VFGLHYENVQNQAQEPQNWLLVLHGILGSGRNWRRFAKELTTIRPDWGARLIDLRMHGKSVGAPPPHSLRACAEDVLQLSSQQSSGRQSILGHSFGGKVVMDMLRCGVVPSVCCAWVIDSSPSANLNAMKEATNTSIRVLEMLEAMPERFNSRAEFASMVTDKGYPPSLAAWLGTNLQPLPDKPSSYRFALDLRAIRTLLADYFNCDLWDSLAMGPPLHVVAASQDSAISEADTQRFHKMHSPRLHLHQLQGGHWLHVDALEELVALVANRLPS
jgi:pimeloyl-ACP methyl ester carboxylesterase